MDPQYLSTHSHLPIFPLCIILKTYFRHHFFHNYFSVICYIICCFSFWALTCFFLCSLFLIFISSLKNTATGTFLKQTPTQIARRQINIDLSIGMYFEDEKKRIFIAIYYLTWERARASVPPCTFLMCKIQCPVWWPLGMSPALLAA